MSGGDSSEVTQLEQGVTRATFHRLVQVRGASLPQHPSCSPQPCPPPFCTLLSSIPLLQDFTLFKKLIDSPHYIISYPRGTFI